MALIQALTFLCLLMGPTRLPYRAADTFVFAQFTQFRANIDPVFDIDLVVAFGAPHAGL